MRSGLLADLAAEGEALERLLVPSASTDWARPTPAAGWTVAHQVAHLAWTDEVALLAATDPAAFAVRAAGEPADAVTRGAEEGAADPPAALLARWRTGRGALAEALAAVPDGTRLPWFGPPMSAASMATARLMETWAHGVDVGDALGRPPHPSARLDHVAHLGVRTRAFAFAAHGRPAPTAPIRVELTRTDGSRWTDGPPDAGQSVTGPLLDFCLRVVQRRPRTALSLVAVGSDADAWLDVAQAFAGPPGRGSDGLP
ncbi:TIGR03084 family metal-binding protein [Modestobacter sp. VKM Ac-2985]|uniref:TIGR03084 family metal-binding protein n=1 Tax=Modestobacter sp. VKM Ac-2985 TaxID=3004139 RepID=UPI0022AB56D2|nr:TIGR03084 family metal-binding protein [Modestobacter sp. VKM Ac-2985]MCZ2835980.1 TIGR03084 family metal-binding protein [Modestobacter sp. VKM Ac-2985]